MKILMVNKFLHPAGGAETYVLRLGEHLTQLGHQVEYFGMEHPDRVMGNRWGLYTSYMDFHSASLLAQATYPLRVVYSVEARRKMTQLLEFFRPDVMHINNFNYQLTPSILVAAENYRRKGNPLRIVYTAHDSQLVCPNHILFNPAQGHVCEKCLTGGPSHCIKGRCIHSSLMRSALGAVESAYWKQRKIYEALDVILCPSAFMKRKLDTNAILAQKTVTLPNFVTPAAAKAVEKENYVLYFGRFSVEKGIEPLVEACKALPEIPFVFAGSGPMEELVKSVPNGRYVGFQTGEALKELIGKARFSVCPSVCHDNAPFSVMESLMAGTPALGSNRGGIPDLIADGRTGWLYDADDPAALTETLRRVWNSGEPEQFVPACREVHFDSLAEYTEKLMTFYTQP